MLYYSPKFPPKKAEKEKKEPKTRIEKVWMNAETAKAQREYERAKRRAC